MEKNEVEKFEEKELRDKIHNKKGTFFEVPFFFAEE